MFGGGDILNLIIFMFNNEYKTDLVIWYPFWDSKLKNLNNAIKEHMQHWLTMEKVGEACLGGCKKWFSEFNTENIKLNVCRSTVAVRDVLAILSII